MKINKWEWFEINSIFKLEKCKCYSATELLENGKDIYYIGAKKNDNGIMQRVKYVEELISKGNCITFIGDGQGSIGYTTYQPIDFIGSTTLTCGYNYKLNKYNALFLTTVLNLERFKYSFGRKYGKSQLLKTKIKLPSKDGQPDWDFMGFYTKNIIHNAGLKTESIINKCFNTLPLNDNKIILQKSDWSYFSFDYLFDIKKGKRLTKADMEEGDTFFVGSSDSNNGLTAKISQAPIFKANTITVNYDGSVAEAFYQLSPYWALDSVNVLYPKFQLNVYTALFLTTIIRLEKYRFNYGRKWKSKLMKKSKIKLPSKNGEPDFKFMESYIKSLPYSSSI